MKFKLKAVVAAALALLPITALADPISVVLYLGTVLISNVYVQVGLIIVAGVYGSAKARKAQRTADAMARAQRLSGLQEQSVTLLSEAPFWRIVYGRKVVGGDIIAAFTSDKASRTEAGVSYNRPDCLKHFVIEIAHHEIAAIHDVYLDGVAVGTLDGNGYPIAGSPFYISRFDSRMATIVAGDTFVDVPDAVASLINAIAVYGDNPVSGNFNQVDVTAGITLSIGNTRITTNATAGFSSVQINYKIDSPLKSVRIQKHLGSPSQTVDTYLNGLFPTEWDSSHRLRGAAYIVLTLDLEDQRHQSGVNPTFFVSGRLCFDRRTSTTIYTENPAVCIDDWLQAQWGYKIALADIDGTIQQEAANDCDARSLASAQAYSQTFTVDVSGNLMILPLESPLSRLDGVRFTTTGTLPAPLATATTYYLREVGEAADNRKKYQLCTSVANSLAGTIIDITTAGTGTHTCTWFDYPTYTLNGAFSTADSKESILEEMVDAMAGRATDSGLWIIQAGAWKVPVMDLTEADLDGFISLPRCDTGYNELYNGIHGQFIPRSKSASIGYDDYQNATFLSGDGEPLWAGKSFWFSDNAVRCRNLARINVEDNRNGQVIVFPAKLRAWPLQIGDRVTVTSAEYGLSAKAYRVTDWQFSISSVVMLTLQEDASTVYDLADAATLDPTPNSGLPDPSIVAAMTFNGTPTTTPTRHPDGTIVPRITVAWNAPTDALMMTGTGRIVLNWRRAYPPTWNRIEVPGDELSVSFEGPREGDILTLELYAINSLRVGGPPAYLSYTVAITTVPRGELLKLIKHGTNSDKFLFVVGNSAAKIGGDTTAWNMGVYSQAPISNACEVSYVVDQADKNLMVGVNTDPTLDASYASIDYAIFTRFDATIDIYESSVAAVSNVGGGYAAGDRFSIRYTGCVVEYRKNNTLLRVTPAPMNLVFSLDNSFQHAGSVSQLAFNPITARACQLRVSAYGGAASGYPSEVDAQLHNTESADLVVWGAGRSYMMVRFDRATGVATFGRVYDVYGVGAVGGFTASTLATDLNASGADSVVVVWTYDEPQLHRLDSGLDAAMYRCGASAIVFGASSFRAKSAYILIGIPGCGQGNGFEAYKGDVDNDTGAWCHASFQITQQGQLFVNGTLFTDLRPGVVTTTTLALASATSVAAALATFAAASLVSSTDVTTTAVSLSYVNDTGATIDVQVETAIAQVFPYALINLTTHLIYLDQTGAVGGNATYTLDPVNTDRTGERGPAAVFQFSVANGATLALAIKIHAAAASTGVKAVNCDNVQLRLAAIKR